MTDDRPVLLVNPNRMKPAVAPLALDLLGHALTTAGCDVACLDLCFSDEPAADVAACLRQRRPRLVGISLRNTDDVYMASRDFFVPQVKALVEAVRVDSDSLIVIGGAGFAVAPQAILDMCGADFGIVGDGEVALPLLAQRLADGSDFGDVPGLVYRDGRRLDSASDAWRRNPPTFAAPQPDVVPGREFVDNRRYFAEGGQGNLETKRGCPMPCTYCADPLSKGSRSRLRSPRAVADEVEALLAQGIDTLHLCDSEFNVPEDHALAICRELADRGLGRRLRWYCYAAPTPFSAELAVAARRAGCVGINFGADSAAAAMLRTLGRTHTADDLVRTVAICRANGIVVMYDLLLGAPGETRPTVRQTIEQMKAIQPDRVGISLGVRLFWGTPLVAALLRQGPLEANPSVSGPVADNPQLLAPVFYREAALGDDIEDYLAQLVAGDSRFLLPAAPTAQNYNYNDNTTLVQAIRDGYRGAYWDILRRLAERDPSPPRSIVLP